MSMTGSGWVSRGAQVVTATVSAVLVGRGPAPMDPVDWSADGSVTDWELLVAEVDRALAGGDGSTAARGWHEAYGAALGTRRWPAMAAVGDAALRIARLGGPWEGLRAAARHCYLVALFRARGAGSAEGVARAAGALETPGDPETAARARLIAEGLLPVN